MTDFIPLFPLKLVVFPNENLNLHIFEPRYKQLIRECKENGTTFGIPAFINNKVMPYGTEMELMRIVHTHENGEMDIKTRGKGIFHIDRFFQEVPNKLYSGADISRIANDNDRDIVKSEIILERLRELFKILKIKKPLPKSADALKLFHWAHLIGLNLEDEYRLLSIRKESERQEFVIRHLEKMIPIVRQMHALKRKANMNGHFKNIIPPKF